MPKESQAKKVAKKVIEQVTSGQFPNVTKAMEQVGYSRTTARARQKRVTEHPDYQKEVFDFEKALDELILDAVEGMKKKKGKASYRDFNAAIDTLNKNKRLIQGKTTENHGISSLLDDLERQQ